MPKLRNNRHWPFLCWNIVQFQIGWFALVASAAAGQPHWGGLILSLLVLAHLVSCRQPFAEALLLLLLALVGWSWETAVQSSGWLVFAGQMSPLAAAPTLQLLPAPWWMALMWVNFATTVNHSLAWLSDRRLLSVAAGMVGGPLAFVAGERLGAVQFLRTPEIYCLLVFGWGCLLPLSLTLGRWLQDRLTAAVSPAVQATALGSGSR